jgi:serine/threonine protein kinase/tetratricopeptide (TPR) repeat protein
MPSRIPDIGRTELHPMIPSVLGHYRVVEKIGAGGMGEVYRAYDEQLDRYVALKVLPPGFLADEAARKRFRTEALALAKLNHPNIETVYEFGTQDGVDFLAMELITGNSLSEKVKDGSLTQAEIVRLGMQLADGLTAAHAQGVIHRDLKPGNLMVTPEGRLKILDFGLAKLIHPVLDTDLTRSIAERGVVSGTLPYMSPEQLRGMPVDVRCDIYSAGVVLYEMATGHRPFPQSQSAELIGAILHQAPAKPSSLNPHINAGVENVILKTLEKEASQRYHSAGELRVALEGSSLAAPATVAISSSSLKQASTHAPRTLPWGAIFTVVALTGLAAGGWYYYTHRGHSLRETDTIVLADFANSTGDSVFDGTLRQGLSVQLAQSPFLSVVSADRVEQTLGLMGRPSNTQLTPEIAREVCQRTDSAAVVKGSIASLGNAYVVGLTAENCRSGISLAEEQITATRKEDVLKALGKASTNLRRRLGESLASIEKFDKPLPEATTSSLEALQAYALGAERFDQGEDLAAVGYFKRAAAIDPEFASAYGSLGAAYANMRQDDVALGYFKQALIHKEHASSREQMKIDAEYYSIGDDVENTIQAWEIYKRTYPRDRAPYVDLANLYLQLGEFEQSLQNALVAVRLDPDEYVGYSSGAYAYMGLNKLSNAGDLMARAAQRKIGGSRIHYDLGLLALAEGDRAAVEREDNLAKASPEFEYFVLPRDAELAASQGEMRRSRDIYMRAVAMAQRLGFTESAARNRVEIAWAEAQLELCPDALRDVAAALKPADMPEVMLKAADVYARCGDEQDAAKLVAAGTALRPNDTLLQYVEAPVIRAVLEMNRGHASQAIELLAGAARYDRSESESRYTRGCAYLLAGQNDHAAAEFQGVVNVKNYWPPDLIVPLAELGLARAYSRLHEDEKARTALQQFQAKWKNPDPDVPIVREVKVDFAKLQ